MSVFEPLLDTAAIVLACLSQILRTPTRYTCPMQSTTGQIDIFDLGSPDGHSTKGRVRLTDVERQYRIEDIHPLTANNFKCGVALNSNYLILS